MMPDNITALTVTTVLIQHCKVINLISLADLGETFKVQCNLGLSVSDKNN